MTNGGKIILDLCGGTGSWSEPYRKAGYEVHVITLPSYDILATTWDTTHLWFMPTDGKHVLKIPINQVHGILAAPPCTMFSRARTTAKTPRDFDGAISVVRACFGIVWTCRSAGRLEFWALENPMGLLRQFIGNPSYSFRGWEFGDDHVKFTDLWGYFNRPTNKRGARAPIFDRKKWALAKKPKKYQGVKLSRADVRAITPRYFAQAFFKANR